MPFYPIYLNIHWKTHRRGGITKIMLIMFSIWGLEIWGDMCLLCKTSLSVCQLLQPWASNAYVLSGRANWGPGFSSGPVWSQNSVGHTWTSKFSTFVSRHTNKRKRKRVKLISLETLEGNLRALEGIWSWQHMSGRAGRHPSVQWPPVAGGGRPGHLPEKRNTCASPLRVAVRGPRTGAPIIRESCAFTGNSSVVNESSVTCSLDAESQLPCSRMRKTCFAELSHQMFTEENAIFYFVRTRRRSEGELLYLRCLAAWGVLKVLTWMAFLGYLMTATVVLDLEDTDKLAILWILQ